MVFLSFKEQELNKFVIILDQFDFESIPLQKFKSIRQNYYKNTSTNMNST